MSYSTCNAGSSGQNSARTRLLNAFSAAQSASDACWGSKTLMRIVPPMRTADHRRQTAPNLHMAVSRLPSAVVLPIPLELASALGVALTPPEDHDADRYGDD